MATFETTHEPGIRCIARHLEDLPPQRLRRAVVLVPSERHAHAIRRHIVVERERPQDLAGALFVRPVELARELLARSGRIVLPGWETIRRLRVHTLLADGELEGALAHFEPTQLRCEQRHAIAFSRVIEELEAGGIDAVRCADIAARLRRENHRDGDRLHDLALIWAAADRQRGGRVSTAELLIAASAMLAAGTCPSAAQAPVYALLTSTPSTVLLRFLGALADCRVVFQEATPVHSLRQQEPQDRDVSAPSGSDLSLLQRYLFELPRLPERPRSSAPDGSVDLEEHPTVEDEIEAAAVWVTEQIEKGTPLEQIALVGPRMRLYALALRDRLSRIGDGEIRRSIPVHIAGGLALADTPAGRRFRVLLEALLFGLEAEATIRLLPSLRRGATEAADSLPRLSPSRAAEIVYGAGISGGSRENGVGAGEWVERLTRRRDALRRLIAAADDRGGSRDESEKRTQIIGRHQANRWLRDVEPVLPGIAALQQVAESVAAGASLPAVWSGIHQLAKDWLRLPPDPPHLVALLAQRLQPLLLDPATEKIRGAAAVGFVIDQLQAERTVINRFGEPSVFIGSTRQAAGLSFVAVRVLGLAGGAEPLVPHDDPILSDLLRQRIEEVARETHGDIAVPRLADSAVDETRDAYRVISAARGCLALSAPRLSSDGSERGVAGVMLEVATGLGRGPAGDDMSTLDRLRSAYFEPGRRARAAATAATPLTPRALLSSVVMPAPGIGAASVRVPNGWLAPAALDVAHLRRLVEAFERRQLSGLDGALVQTWKSLMPPGIGKQPLSASALGILLSCPHRFMLERLLRMGPPASRPLADAIEPVIYGALFHTAVERFLGEAGAALCRREGKLDDWIARAQAIAAAELAELGHVHPLRGDAAIDRERARLLRQIGQLVEYEWKKAPREFVAVELGFGEPEPVRLGGEAGLGVRGAVDRVDRLVGGGLSVRDIKTGRIRALADEPINVRRDLQVGLYALAIEAGGPERVVEAAYVYPSDIQQQERAFTGDDLERLRERTRSWLEIARRILATGLFVRTPNADDCRFCPFVPACGEDAQKSSAAKLKDLPRSHPLAPFVRMKREGLSERH